MNCMGVLVVLLTLLSIQFELFRRLVMDVSGKYVAHKVGDIAAIVQAVESLAPVDSYCQACLVRAQ